MFCNLVRALVAATLVSALYCNLLLWWPSVVALLTHWVLDTLLWQESILPLGRSSLGPGFTEGLSIADAGRREGPRAVNCHRSL